MSRKPPAPKPTEEQKAFLLSHMELNVKFSQNEFYSLTGRETLQKDWETLKTNLNNLPGPCTKTTAEWQKVCGIQKKNLCKRSYQETAWFYVSVCVLAVLE